MTDQPKPEPAGEMSSGPVSSWERLYHLLEPEKLPWHAGRPDPDLVELVDKGFLAPGNALDVGTGQGCDAVFLASKGFQVTAVDIAPSAIKLALERAAGAGVEGKIEFRTEDVLRMDLAPEKFSFVNDRGFFHYLRGEDRPAYAGRVARALAPAGIVLLRVFSDKEPPSLGPLRYSEAELRKLLEGAFSFEGVKESVFEGPSKAKSLVALLRRK